VAITLAINPAQGDTLRLAAIGDVRGRCHLGVQADPVGRFLQVVQRARLSIAALSPPTITAVMVIATSSSTSVIPFSAPAFIGSP
jgi:hypothetical protein